MKGASAGHSECLMFMRPRQIIWKSQIAEQIDHFDVSIHGTRIGVDMQILTVKRIAALWKDLVSLYLCQTDQVIDKSVDGW